MALLRKVLKAAAGLAVAVVVPNAQAVLIGPGIGTQNTTVPPGPPIVNSWYNIGKLSQNAQGAGGIGGGVYLGNQWVLTAAHLDASFNHFITFYPTDNFPSGGQAFQLDASTVTRVRNADNSVTDMDMIRMLVDPGLPSLTLPAATPAAPAPEPTGS